MSLQKRQKVLICKVKQFENYKIKKQANKNLDKISSVVKKLKEHINLNLFGRHPILSEHLQ